MYVWSKGSGDLFLSPEVIQHTYLKLSQSLSYDYSEKQSYLAGVHPLHSNTLVTNEMLASFILLFTSGDEGLFQKSKS